MPKLNRNWKQVTLALLVLCLLAACSLHRGGHGGPASRGNLTLDAPGVALEQPSTLLVAAQLRNDGRRNANEVTVDSIRLGDVPLLTGTPVAVGRIDAGQSALVQANFSGGEVTPGTPYRLVINGTYQAVKKGGYGEGRRRPFMVDGVIVLPPKAPGSADVKQATAEPNRVSGAIYPPQRPSFDEEVNGSRWTVPTGRFVPGAPTPTETGTEQVQLGDPPAIVFNVNNGAGITNGSSVAEPSGAAAAGNVVFLSANWFAAFSTNGGGTFNPLNPTTIFPNDAIGFCCDQIVQYVPGIDRFIWLLQGNNGFRLAAASRAAIVNNNGTAWTYWNLPSSLFGQPAGTGVDYPDLSVGNNSLYLSWDVGWPACPAGCRSGFQVSRISLAGIQAGGTITIDYTNPPDASMAWGGHLMQNTLDEIFWAGHNSNSQMRVFSLQEGSNTYFWRDVGVSSWANNALSSTTPDGQDWLNKASGFPRNAVIGSTRVGNQLWFAWNAGTNDNFQQAHVEMVTLDRNNNFNKIQQVQIWNNSYAFAYPALATNACTGEVGLSFEYGGNGNYENHVVGFWGDFVAYITTSSNVGTGRFGDYVTIRQAPSTNENPGNLFDAFGYGLNRVPPPGAGTQTDIHYVLFGRPAAQCRVIG